jgi:hypothetical protein
MPRKHVPAGIARGPRVLCPAPVVNVPQQAAPVVNVPAPEPTVGVATDNCNIYIVRGNQLTVVDKNTYQVRRTVPIQ